MKTIALVIGVSQYQDDAFMPLPGACVDSKRFTSSLTSFGLPPSSIIHISDSDATKAKITIAFHDLRSEFDTDTKFIFYFAGHGMHEKESFLILFDTDSKNLAESGLDLVQLMQLTQSLRPSQTFMFIDACRLHLNEINIDTEIFSTTSSTGLFCIFSSGLMPSYEDVQQKGGYFTTALIRAFQEHYHTKNATCFDILAQVEQMLYLQELPTPALYHVGSSKMWPFKPTCKGERRCALEANFIERIEALSTLEHYLKSSSIIWMWGESGLGKSVIAEQLMHRHPNALYLSYNGHAVECEPHSLLIFDHIDRLSPDDIQSLLFHVDQLPNQCLFISRTPCPKDLSVRREVTEWKAPALTSNEIEELIGKSGLQSFSQVLVNATSGNALKLRQMLVKLSGQNISLHELLEDLHVNF